MKEKQLLKGNKKQKKKTKSIYYKATEFSNWYWISAHQKGPSNHLIQRYNSLDIQIGGKREGETGLVRK